jgi:hypothetical protein
MNTWRSALIELRYYGKQEYDRVFQILRLLAAHHQYDFQLPSFEVSFSSYLKGLKVYHDNALPADVYTTAGIRNCPQPGQ